MGDQLITPNTQSTESFSLQLDGTMPYFRTRSRWSRWIGWQQWLVLFAMGALVTVIEARNHTRMWVEHESGQTIWTDPELIGEIITFGLVLPILAGMVLGYLARTAVERDRMARELEMRRELVARMHEAQSWPELAELVVQIPGDVVSADRAWLLAQRSGEEEFDQIVHWERTGNEFSPSYPPVSPVVCESCAQTSTLDDTRILTCQHMSPESGASHGNRYCLWLSDGGMGKTALLFDMPSGHLLDPNQRKVLDDLGDEMSLAIDNANLHHVGLRQVDMANLERQRIARDLHDSLGQNISVLRMKLEHLSDSGFASGSAEFDRELASMLIVADEAYEQVRDTLEELRTTEHIELVQDIRNYASQAAERAGFLVEVRSSGEARKLSPRQNRQMMYIVREALNNVEKHAGAQNVDIYLQWRDREFRLTVRDDGKGFDPEIVNTEDQYGLAIMGERSRSINADLTIESSQGNGTEVMLSLPLPSSVPAMRIQ